MNPTKDQTREAYRKLPYPLRDYLASTNLYDLMQEFMKRYSLRIDVAGKIESATTNMMLGFINPAQFQQELRMMGLQDTTTNAIMSELNDRVFIPLQNKIKAGQTDATEAESEEDNTANEIAETPKPASIPPPAVFKAPPPVPKPLTSAPTFTPVTALPKNPTPPAAPTTPPPATLAPTPASSRPGMAPSFTPLTALPRPMPGAPGSTPAPSPSQLATPTPNPDPAKQNLHDVLKQYGVDPYRELPE